MNKISTRFFLLLLFIVCYAINAAAQTVNITNVDAGPYGQGSSIMSKVTVTGCLNPNNRFNIYLSDANGNFSGTGTLIGTFIGTYTTFVNGTIPNNAAAGTNYRVRVASTSPAITSTASGTFAINAAAGTPIDLTASQYLNTNNMEVFGQCDNTTQGSATTSFTFTNGTAAGATVTATLTNELDNGDVTSFTFNTPDRNFSAKAAHYTIASRAEAANGTISTRGYLLVNNRATLNAFKISQIGTACLPNNGTISFAVDIANGNESLRNAYPGNIYTVTWGDGTSNLYSVCEIIAANGLLSHTYSTSSCGNTITVGGTTFFNSYGLTIRASNSYCGTLSGASIAPVKVLAPAFTNFGVQGLADAAPLRACVGNVTFKNLSDPGDNPATNTSNCKNPNARYNWYVNGVLIPPANRTLAQVPTYNFTSAGTYTVRLVLLSGSGCQSDPNDPTNFMERQICIQNPPDAEFNIQGQNAAVTVCAPISITPVNTSTIDETCQLVSATWSVTGGPANGYTITGPVNSATTPPKITFNAAGVYTVRLRLASGTCAISTHDVVVTVSTPPIAELPPNISICGGGNGQVVYSSDPANDFYARLEGTSNEDATTYTWQIIPVSGAVTATISNPNAKYPTISYSGIGAFRVRVTHVNNCATAQDDQVITVEDAPVVDPGTYTAVCPGDDIPLNLTTITGNYQSLEWTGGTGTFSPNRNVLNPVYTPSPAEIQAGGVTLNLVVNTGLSGTCSTITTPVPLTIRPQNIITSASAKTICTGSNVDYDIIAQSGSTFTWTVVSSTNVTGAQDGSGIAIDDLLANTSPNNSDGEVVYRITPFNSGCQGVSFTFTVTVVANVAPTFTTSATFVCGTQQINFTNTTASQSGTYRWDWNDGNPPETATANPTSHTFAANADGTDRRYRITLIHEYACGTRVSAEQEILVKPEFPVARIGTPTRTSINGTGNGECGSFILTVPNQSPSNSDTYEFRLEDENGNLVSGNIVTTPNPVMKTTAGDKSAAQFTVVPNGNATYYIRMRATSSCNSADIPNRWAIPVSTSGFSSMNIVEAQACQGTPVTFQNNSIGTGFTYNVYRSDGSLFDTFNITNNQPSFTYTGFTEAGTFRVSVTARSAGCGDAPASNPADNEIEIIPVPSISFTANTVGCDNLIYQFTPTGIISGTYNYSWDFGDGTADIPGPNPGPHTYATPGTYTVTLTVTNSLGCNVPVAPVLVVARPRLVADFTVLPGEEIFIPNYHFTFRDNSEGVPASWLWDFGNGESSNLPNPEYTYPATDIGSHLVTLTVTNIAPDGSTCTSVKQKSVTISGTPGTLFIPNAFIPSSSSTAIQTFMAKGSGIESWHMQIFNKWGQLVWETNKLGTDGEPLEGWDGTYKGSPAPQGAYVWQVSAKFINGTEWKGMSYRNSPPKRSGVINLIR